VKRFPGFIGFCSPLSPPHPRLKNPAAAGARCKYAEFAALFFLVYYFSILRFTRRYAAKSFPLSPSPPPLPSHKPSTRCAPVSIAPALRYLRPPLFPKTPPKRPQIESTEASPPMDYISSPLNCAQLREAGPWIQEKTLETALLRFPFSQRSRVADGPLHRYLFVSLSPFPPSLAIGYLLAKCRRKLKISAPVRPDRSLSFPHFLGFFFFFPLWASCSTAVGTSAQPTFGPGCPCESPTSPLFPFPFFFSFLSFCGVALYRFIGGRSN